MYVWIQNRGSERGTPKLRGNHLIVFPFYSDKFNCLSHRPCTLLSYYSREEPLQREYWIVKKNGIEQLLQRGTCSPLQLVSRSAPCLLASKIRRGTKRDGSRHRRRRRREKEKQQPMEQQKRAEQKQEKKKSGLAVLYSDTGRASQDCRRRGRRRWSNRWWWPEQEPAAAAMEQQSRAGKK